MFERYASKAISINSSGEFLKLILAWWGSQPIRYRVRERRPIKERLQSFRLKTHLSLFWLKMNLKVFISPPSGYGTKPTIAILLYTIKMLQFHWSFVLILYILNKIHCMLFASSRLTSCDFFCPARSQFWPETRLRRMLCGADLIDSTLHNFSVVCIQSEL